LSADTPPTWSAAAARSPKLCADTIPLLLDVNGATVSSPNRGETDLQLASSSKRSPRASLRGSIKLAKLLRASHHRHPSQAQPTFLPLHAPGAVALEGSRSTTAMATTPTPAARLPSPSTTLVTTPTSPSTTSTHRWTPSY
jgi:hypothetical protein